MLDLAVSGATPGQCLGEPIVDRMLAATLRIKTNRPGAAVRYSQNWKGLCDSCERSQQTLTSGRDALYVL